RCTVRTDHDGNTAGDTNCSSRPRPGGRPARVLRRAQETHDGGRPDRRRPRHRRGRAPHPDPRPRPRPRSAGALARPRHAARRRGPHGRSVQTPWNSSPDDGLVVVEDDRVPAKSWYLMSDQWPTIATAHLAATGGPELLSMDGWNVDGRLYKA